MIVEQQSLGMAPKVRSKVGPKPVPTKKCSGCGQKIVQYALQGTLHADAVKGPSGDVIKCDPEMVPDGTFFLVGKIFHRRRDTDEGGVWFKLHRCSGF